MIPKPPPIKKPAAALNTLILKWPNNSPVLISSWKARKISNGVGKTVLETRIEYASQLPNY